MIAGLIAAWVYSAVGQLEIESFNQTMAQEIKDLHATLKQFCSQPQCKCMTSSLDIEVSYLRLRRFKPNVVWEISPSHGFSTTAILLALRANGRGHLHSFDVYANSRRCVDPGLQAGWTFHRKDVTTASWGHRKLPDYLWLDSLHNEKMGNFYVTRLLPLFKAAGVPLIGQLHDVFHPLMWYDEGPPRSFETYPKYLPTLEGSIFFSWYVLQHDDSMRRAYTLSADTLSHNPQLGMYLKRRSQWISNRTGVFVGPRNTEIDCTVWFEVIPTTR